MHRTRVDRINRNYVLDGHLPRARSSAGKTRMNPAAGTVTAMPGDGAGPTRHYRFHDGLRHHRHRARPGADKVQETVVAGSSRSSTTNRAAGAHQAGASHARAGGADCQPHRFHRHTRRARTEAGAPGVSDLQLPPQNGRALHHYRHGADDGGGAAVHVRGAISKTINSARRSTVDRHRERLHRELEAGTKADRHYRDNSKKVQPLSSGRLEGR